MKFRFVLVFLPLSLAACDGQFAQDFHLPWDKPQATTPEATQAIDPTKTPLVTPSVSPNDVPIEVQGEHVRIATAEASTMNASGFIARGNEPFWRIDVTGGTAKYRTPENQSGTNIAVRRIVYREGVEYIGESGGSPFSLNIRPTECTDSMSGVKLPMTAQLRIGSERKQGCAAPISAVRSGDTPAAQK